MPLMWTLPVSFVGFHAIVCRLYAIIVRLCIVPVRLILLLCVCVCVCVCGSHTPSPFGDGEPFTLIRHHFVVVLVLPGKLHFSGDSCRLLVILVCLTQLSGLLFGVCLSYCCSCFVLPFPYPFLVNKYYYLRYLYYLYYIYIYIYFLLPGPVLRHLL